MKTTSIRLFSIVLAACILSSCARNSMKDELTMVVGTYTSGNSQGIYTYKFNQDTGEAQALSHAPISNPSYLDIAWDNQFVFAVSEHGDGSESVSAFTFDIHTGTLEPINSQPAMGADPCYIESSPSFIVSANYSGGSISVFPIQTNGRILPAANVFSFQGAGQDAKRQTKPHLHCVQFSPDSNYLFATDLGTDHIYKFIVNRKASDAKDFLTASMPAEYELPAGTGPRHLTFAPNRKYAYLIGELSGEVIAFKYADGALEQIQSIPADETGARGSADIHISPDGKFLYASNRLRQDGLAIFSIDPENGMLTKAGYQLTGAHPRNFVITPNGKFLLVASRDRNAIEVYRRDRKSGLLKNTGKDIAVDMPVCLKFGNL